MRVYGRLIRQAGAAWIDHRAPTLGAALAFYSAFALAPLLIIAIALARPVFGLAAARQAIVGQLGGLVGAPAARAIEGLLTAAQESTTGAVATAVGFATMLIAASTLVVELQDDLDLIWKAPKREGSSWLGMLRARVLSLGMILGIGFLLLVSLVLNSALTATAVLFQSYFPGAAIAFVRTSALLFSFGATTLLFAMLYKSLPNAPVAWKDVWTGAIITAVLFSGGRFVIGLYLGRTALASAYGAAGTLVVLLLWLYYSAQVFLFGAEFTSAYARYRSGRQRGRAR